MKDHDLSARTINFCRQIVVAFLNWCMKTGRTEANPLAVIPKLDESRDRRHVRRPLTEDELRRLLAVADPYLTAIEKALGELPDVERDAVAQHMNALATMSKKRRHAILTLTEDET